MCLGAKFAQVEGTIALALIARKFLIKPPPDMDKKKFFSFQCLLTLQPAVTAKLRLTPRQH